MGGGGGGGGTETETKRYCIKKKKNKICQM